MIRRKNLIILKLLMLLAWHSMASKMEYDDMKQTQPVKLFMNKPMTCYRKTAESKPMKRLSNTLPEKLLSQATRLLGIATMQNEDFKGLSEDVMKQITIMVQQLMSSKNMKTPSMTKPTKKPEPTTTQEPIKDLGENFLGILNNLIGEEEFFSAPGLTITKVNSTEEGDPQKQRDTPMNPTDPPSENNGLNQALGNLGVDLNNLDLSTIDLESLGFDREVIMSMLPNILGGGPPTTTKPTEKPETHSESEYMEKGKNQGMNENKDMNKPGTDEYGNNKDMEMKNEEESTQPPMPTSPLNLPNIDLGNIDLSNIDPSIFAAFSGMDINSLLSSLNKPNTGDNEEDGEDNKKPNESQSVLSSLGINIPGLDLGNIDPSLVQSLLPSLLPKPTESMEKDDDDNKKPNGSQSVLSSLGINIPGLDLGNIDPSLVQSLLPSLLPKPTESMEKDDDDNKKPNEIQSILSNLGINIPGLDLSNIDPSLVQSLLPSLLPKPTESMEKEKEENKDKGKMEPTKEVPESVKNLLNMVGVDDEEITDEESVIPAIMKALQFVMSADDSTLNNIADSLKNFDFSVFQGIGDDDEEEEDEDEGKLELVCSPSDDEEESKNKMNEDMDKGDCKAMMSENSCEKMMTEFKKEMKSMVEEEVQRIFKDVGEQMKIISPEMGTFFISVLAQNEITAKGKKLTIEKWTQWTEWDSCSRTCGGGISIRSRMCVDEYMTEDRSECEESESRSCNIEPCEDDMFEKVEKTTSTTKKWNEWSDWDPCTQSCGGGVSIRSRTCTSEFMSESYETQCEDSETRICNVQACEMNTEEKEMSERQWGEWSDWDICSEDCGGGTTSRMRFCLDGLLDCEDIETMNCNTQECVAPTPVERVWGEWGDWKECSAECEGGVSSRVRFCLDQQPDCEDEETKVCNEQPCPPPTPAERKWGEWSIWGDCTFECGGGTTRRVRFCMDNLDDCEQEEYNQCNMEPCEVERQWGEWTAWGPCTAKCNGGTSFRARVCTDLLDDCQDVESKVCNEQACPPPTTQAPVEQQWLQWQEWSPCSVTCGAGLTTRERTCVKKSTTTGCSQIQTKTCLNSPCVLTPITRNCPSSAYAKSTMDNRCLVFQDRMLSFESLRAQCQRQGGDIVKITEVDQWVKITYWLRSIYKQRFGENYRPTWIGVTNAGHTTRWTYPDNSEVFTIWGKGEPIENMANRCVKLNPGNGHGITAPCSEFGYGVCQFKIRE